MNSYSKREAVLKQIVIFKNSFYNAATNLQAFCDIFLSSSQNTEVEP